MEKGLLVFLAISLFALSSILVLVQPVHAQPYYDASFNAIDVTNGNGTINLLNGGTAQVYDGQLTTIHATYQNSNCGVLGADLYIKFYENNALTYTSNENYDLKGTADGRQWTFNPIGPTTLSCRVELWWDSSGTYYLEDSKTFNIQVVKLFVANWQPAQISVETGKIAGTNWAVSFQNGGNDIMYKTSISIQDSSGLQITPISTDLGDISSQGTESTSFSVVAPNTLSTGTVTVSFQISYNDFEGTSHAENFSAQVSVTQLGTKITVSTNPSVANEGASTIITAQLLDDNGNPVANEQISFSIGQTSIGTAITGSSGNAVLSYNINVAPQTCVITASFAGSTEYLSSTGTGNLIVTSTPSSTPSVISLPINSSSLSIIVVMVVVIAIIAIIAGLLISRTHARIETEKKLLILLQDKDEIALADLAYSLGFSLDVTKKFLLRSIQHGNVYGYMTLDGEKYLSKNGLRKNLEALLLKY